MRTDVVEKADTLIQPFVLLFCFSRDNSRCVLLLVIAGRQDDWQMI